MFNADGELYAIDDTCTHQDASLSEGWLEGCLIECPAGMRGFDPCGRAADGRRPSGLRTYPVVVHEDVVFVDAPAAQRGVA